MTDQIMRTTSFRTHKKHESNFLGRNFDSFIKTRQNQSFGDLFLKKNKDRLSHLKKSNYFKQTSQPSFIHNNKLQYNEGSPVLNHTMSMPDKVKSISQLQGKFMNSANKSSFRSKLFNVDVSKTQLPKVRTNSSSNFNFNSFSHSKLQNLNYQINQINQEVILLGVQTHETRALMNKTNSKLQTESNQLQKGLKGKIGKLQKFIEQRKTQSNQRRRNLQSQIPVLHTKTKTLKANLDQIQEKLNIIQHSIGYSTSHHKHFV